jgi:SRSO17 transposase
LAWSRGCCRIWRRRTAGRSRSGLGIHSRGGCSRFCAGVRGVSRRLEAEVRRYVVDELGSLEAVLIVDDTQVIKKGKMSVGVAPQHCGATNQTENVPSHPATVT